MVNEDYLLLLFIIPLLVIPLLVFSSSRKAALLRRAADKNLLKYLNADPSPSKRFTKWVLMIFALALIITGLARPRWNASIKPVQNRGRDVVVLLDISRSMLAEDLKPNRLERAKLAIKDLIEKIKGDRVGLVAFAGDAEVKCPLTQDYGFLRLTLDEISPKTSKRGGTNLGDAIRMASEEVFDQSGKDFKDIILITDGGDLESSLPVKAAAAAGEKGIRIIAAGLGDKQQGARIPIYDKGTGEKKFLEYNGNQVWTKLQDETLRKTALASSKGKYIPVETGTFNLGEIYEGIIASSRKRQLERSERIEYEEKFQIFLLGAFAFLSLETVISDKRRKKL
ncbi:calcium-activated chloride channel protein 1 [Sedimentisphaera cyanobacteriorum]|uniref:Calcium-activated chloride channel protein 1 n=2 Tax=Sedimentisphaera cyanobacteriorum TaxID=1940790 RepID=A0A1Q2HLG0_9BACT|nr:calcium-activated chloride channel protein 1 [Sedimentisphaera cyanobacteriorum]